MEDAADNRDADLSARGGLAQGLREPVMPALQSEVRRGPTIGQSDGGVGATAEEEQRGVGVGPEGGEH